MKCIIYSSFLQIGFFKRHRPDDETPLHVHHIETYHQKPPAADKKELDEYESD